MDRLVFKLTAGEDCGFYPEVCAGKVWDKAKQVVGRDKLLEWVDLGGGFGLLVDEEGRMGCAPVVNRIATVLYRRAYPKADHTQMFICGDCVLLREAEDGSQYLPIWTEAEPLVNFAALMNALGRMRTEALNIKWPDRLPDPKVTVMSFDEALAEMAR